MNEMIEDTKGIQEMREAVDCFKKTHNSARDSWVSWVTVMNQVHGLQNLPRNDLCLTNSQLKTYVDFINDFGSIGYRRDAVERRFESIYKAVFVGRRKRTIELGKKADSAFFKDTKLCLSPLGFALRYEYTTHARSVKFSEFKSMLRQGELPHIVALLQNSKQYEVAMNVVQFAKLLDSFSNEGGDGLVVSLKERINISHNFGAYCSEFNSMPRVADEVELDFVQSDRIGFNLLVKDERDKTKFSWVDSEKPVSKISVFISKPDGLKSDEANTIEWLLQAQVWLQIEDIYENMSKAIATYNKWYEDLLRDSQDVFGRYLLMSMLEK